MTSPSVAILGFDAALAQAATQTVERAVRRVVLVVAPTDLRVEFLPRKLK